MSAADERRVGPTKILLLNCGKFDFAQVDIDAPLHLVGANNVGKTSLIALLQLLYIDDQRKMHFARDFAETRRYYFPDVYSYVLFECLTPTGFKVVGARGLGPVRQYEFERFCYLGRLDVEDYVDDEHRIRSHEEILPALADRDFARLQPRHLRAALTGVGDNRGVDLRLVPARHGGTYSRFRKVFNNILRLSHLKQDELKRLVLDVFDAEFQQRSIDLAKTYAHGFERVRKDSQELRDLKLLEEDIKSLLEHIEKREDCRRVLPALWEALGRALTGARSELDREKRDLEGELDQSEQRKRSLDERIEALRQRRDDSANRMAGLEYELRRLDSERERFADFVVEWEEQRKRNLSESIDSLAFKLGQSKREPQSRVEARLYKLENEIELRERRLEGLASSAVHWLRERFEDEELEDVFRLLNPGLLDSKLEGEDAGGRVYDPERATGSLRELLSWRDGRIVRGMGVELDLDEIDAPGLSRHANPGVIRDELEDLLGQLESQREALAAARDAERLTKEKRELEVEQEALIRELGDWGKLRELESREDEWRSELESLQARREAAEREEKECEKERERIVRGIEKTKRGCDDVERQRLALEDETRDLRRPPAEWPLVEVEGLPEDFEELVSRYRRVYRDEQIRQQRVSEILDRIERQTYGVYTAQDESATVRALKEQLESIPEKERAVQELWTSIAVGIKKSLSSIARDIDILKGQIQALNRRIGGVTVSNLTSLRLLVHERPDWVEHIRKISLDEDMPLFADPRAVRSSLEDLGRLLSDHPRIDLEDLFDLRFEVETPDGKLRTHAHLDAIESNGTTVTIKVLVNLVLLSGLLEGANVHIPFYLDECSSLDNDNLAAIVEAAREMGFVAVLASPDAMDAAERLYFIEEGSNGRVVLDPRGALVRVVRKEEDPSDEQRHSSSPEQADR
ncbi:MAG: hypothetical protein R6V85_07700 [Polyangia bacterium]